MGLMSMAFDKALSTINPIMSYIKIGLVAVAVGGAAWVAWELKGSYAEREKAEAVNKAVEGIQKDLDNERNLRMHYQDISDKQLAALLKSISEIKGTQQVISAGIAAERASNPKFYNQPLPEGGYQQWQRAKALIGVSPASSSSSASSQ